MIEAVFASVLFVVRDSHLRRSFEEREALYFAEDLSSVCIEWGEGFLYSGFVFFRSVSP